MFRAGRREKKKRRRGGPDRGWQRYRLVRRCVGRQPGEMERRGEIGLADCSSRARGELAREGEKREEKRKGREGRGVKRTIVKVRCCRMDLSLADGAEREEKGGGKEGGKEGKIGTGHSKSALGLQAHGERELQKESGDFSVGDSCLSG